jgi:hypothetical protein
LHTGFRAAWRPFVTRTLLSDCAANPLISWYEETMSLQPLDDQCRGSLLRGSRRRFYRHPTLPGCGKVVSLRPELGWSQWRWPGFLALKHRPHQASSVGSMGLGSSTIQYFSVSDHLTCGPYYLDRERSPTASPDPDARAQVETAVPLSPRHFDGTQPRTLPGTPMGTLPTQRCREDAGF